MPAAEVFFKTEPSFRMAKAIENSDLSEINRLSKALNINQKNERGMTFLMWSFAQLQYPATETLLGLGANPNIPVEGSFPLSLAALNDDPRWVKLFLKYKANPNQRDDNGNPVWFETLYAHNWELLNYFLDSGANINNQNDVGETAVMKLADLKQYEQVLKLIDRGASITTLTPSGNSFPYNVQFGVPDRGTREFIFRKHVISKLEEKGIHLPVPAPSEIREGKAARPSWGTSP